VIENWCEPANFVMRVTGGLNQPIEPVCQIPSVASSSQLWDELIPIADTLFLCQAHGFALTLGLARLSCQHAVA
jgi:hypothetical protein